MVGYYTVVAVAVWLRWIRCVYVRAHWVVVYGLVYVCCVYRGYVVGYAARALHFTGCYAFAAHTPVTFVPTLTAYVTLLRTLRITPVGFPFCRLILVGYAPHTLGYRARLPHTQLRLRWTPVCTFYGYFWLRLLILRLVGFLLILRLHVYVTHHVTVYS